jgi:hypothetical protein
MIKLAFFLLSHDSINFLPPTIQKEILKLNIQTYPIFIVVSDEKIEEFDEFPASTIDHYKLYYTTNLELIKLKTFMQFSFSNRILKAQTHIKDNFLDYRCLVWCPDESNIAKVF